MMCDSVYEYEPMGVQGTGSGTALSHVEADPKPPLGLLAAAKRAETKREPTKVRIERKR